MIKKTPFTKQSLTATKNMLKVVNQYFNYTFDSRYAFGTGDFTVSMLVQKNTGATDIYMDSGSDVAFLFANTGDFGFSFPALGGGSDFQTTPYVLEVGRIYRVTFVRTGATQSIYVNDRLVKSGTNNGAAFSPSSNVNVGSGGFTCNGAIGNLIWIASSMTAQQVSYLHYNNVLPNDLHQYVVAHYPLNQTHGDKAYDVVEQYNYAKTTPLVAIHGTLQNYTANEEGLGVNPLDQSAFIDLYDKITPAVPVFKKALKFVQSANTYVTVSPWTFTRNKGYTTIIGWCLDSDRAFSGTPWEVFSISGARVLLGINGTRTIDGFNDSNSIQGHPKKSDKIQFLTYTENFDTNEKVYYENGFKTTSAGQTFSNESGTLSIGGFSSAGAGLNGYICLYAVFRSVLTRKQILDIINNTLRNDSNAPDFRPDIMADCQLYLNFEEIFIAGSVYTLKDWSPQNRTVTLVNYTINDVTPGDPAYKLFDLNSLR